MIYHIKCLLRYLTLEKGVNYIDEKDGIEYSYSYPRKTRLIGQIACRIQWCLWKCNIHWHNTIRDECTPDGSCCKHVTHDIKEF